MRATKKLIQLLMQTDKKIVIAESVTGGAICAEIVKYPGASKVLHEGFVTYSDASKAARLGVPYQMINEEGAVSPQVCGAMVRGLLEDKEVDYALAITGYADGREGTAGLIYIGTANAKCANKNIQVGRYLLSGSRNSIRKQAVKEAISLLTTLVRSSL